MNKECGKIGSRFVNFTLSIVRHIFLGKKKPHTFLYLKRNIRKPSDFFINRITFSCDKVMKLTFFTTPFISTPILKNSCIFSSSGSISWKKKNKQNYSTLPTHRKIGQVSKDLKITTDNVFIIQMNHFHGVVDRLPCCQFHLHFVYLHFRFPQVWTTKYVKS